MVEEWDECEIDDGWASGSSSRQRAWDSVSPSVEGGKVSRWMFSLDDDEARELGGGDSSRNRFPARVMKAATGCLMEDGNRWD